MSGVEASVWIRMKRAWDRKPAVKERVDTLPTGMRTITAMPESAPPHLTYPMPEHGESASVTRYATHMGKSQKRERLGFSLSSRAPVLGGEPPELQQPRFLRM